MLIKIKQFFCYHESISQHKKVQKFANIQGETIYYICDKCNKIIKDEFISNEEYNNRYR